MKYLLICSLFLIGCGGNKPNSKKLQYTVVIGNVLLICKNFDHDNLSDCEFGIKEIKNATNVVVEEVK